MKALLCKAWGPPESLEIVTLPDLQAQAGEVVVDVKAAGVNFPDVLMVQGKYQVKPELPFAPGSELAGVVRAVGAGVDGIQPGDRVFANVQCGAFASQARVPSANILPIPEHMGFDLAASFFMAYGTSYHALADRAALKAGETLLVLGASGGVGLAAVEIGKALGARVIAAASSDAKLDICREHGADGCINYSSENLRERIAALTEGKGPDVIFDPVGGALAEPAFRSIGWRGRYLVVGFAGGEIPRLPFNLPLLKGASIVGVFWGGYRGKEPESFKRHFDTLTEWIAAGKIRPRITARYPLEQASQALLDMAARKVVGKIVITP